MRLLLRVVRRFVWLVAGFVLGMGSSLAVRRRVRRATTRYGATEVVDRWTGSVRAAVDEGRLAMRAREAELKSGLARGDAK